MPRSDIFTIRMIPQRAGQIEALESITGLTGPAAIIDFALATTLAHYGTQEVAMNETQARMSTSAERGEEMYEAATNDSISDAVDSYGSIEAVAAVVADLVGGDPQDVVAYIEESIKRDGKALWRKATGGYTVATAEELIDREDGDEDALIGYIEVEL